MSLFFFINLTNNFVFTVGGKVFFFHFLLPLTKQNVIFDI